MTIPKALARQLAVVPIVMGSCAAATAEVAVDRLSDEGSMRSKLLPPVTRRPAVRVLDSRFLMAHCIDTGARLLRCKCPDEPLERMKTNLFTKNVGIISGL